MKNAFLSALIVVTKNFIFLLALQYGLLMVLTPAILIIVMCVSFINNYLHRNPYSPLALTIKTKAFKYPSKITNLFLVIVIIIEFLLFVAYIYYPAWGLSTGLFGYGYIVVLYILGFIAYLVGSKEDKRTGFNHF
jgi:glucose-6-phosphate-specific signal transduction histidine kinase